MTEPHEPYWEEWIKKKGEGFYFSPDLPNAFHAGFEAGVLHRAKILSDPEALSREELQLLQRGRFVAAIKTFRERTGLTLKESKDLVSKLWNKWSK